MVPLFVRTAFPPPVSVHVPEARIVPLFVELDLKLLVVFVPTSIVQPLAISVVAPPEFILLKKTIPLNVPVHVIRESSSAPLEINDVVAFVAEKVPPETVKFFHTSIEEVAPVDEGAEKYPPE